MGSTQCLSSNPETWKPAASTKGVETFHLPGRLAANSPYKAPQTRNVNDDANENEDRVGRAGSPVPSIVPGVAGPRH